MNAAVGSGERHEYIAATGDRVVIGDAEPQIDEPCRQPRIVDQALVPKLGVGDKLKNSIPCIDMTSEKADLLQRTSNATSLDVVADFEGPQPEQHDAGRNVCQRTLQGEADCKTNGAES